MVYKKKDRREGHCNWTDAEVESLKFQADVLHLEWPSIAKTFEVDGFVRHNSTQCFKKWTEVTDRTDQTPVEATKPQETTQS